MRFALVSLIAAAALAGAAAAQPTDTAPPATTEPAAAPPPATPTETAPPAVPAETPAPPPAAPATPDAAPAPANPATPPGAEPVAPPPPPPAPPAEPPPPPPPPPPPAPPTDPMAIRILDTLERVCIPAVADGGNLDTLARGAGFRRSRDTYTLRQGQVNIVIQPLSSDHRTCRFLVDYPIDTLQPTIVGVHNWAMGRAMTLRDPYRLNTDFQRDIRSWERDADALVLMAMKKNDGNPVTRNADRAEVLYQRRQ